LIRKLEGHDWATMQMILCGHMMLLKQCGLSGRARIVMGLNGPEIWLINTTVKAIDSLRVEKECHLKGFFSIKRKRRKGWVRFLIPQRWKDFSCIVGALVILYSVRHPVLSDRVKRHKKKIGEMKKKKEKEA
jgi:hypothetical protein